jgi:Hydantoinase/oxoprolinase C-terminal domain
VQIDSVGAITFTPLLRAQYFGQLNDLELASPASSRLQSREDVDAVLEVFEELYAKIYRRSARTPEFGRDPVTSRRHAQGSDRSESRSRRSSLLPDTGRVKAGTSARANERRRPLLSISRAPPREGRSRLWEAGGAE